MFILESCRPFGNHIRSYILFWKAACWTICLITLGNTQNVVLTLTPVLDNMRVPESKNVVSFAQSRQVLKQFTKEVFW